MDQILEVLRAMCKRVSSPVAERVLAHACKGEWDHIQNMAIDPRTYQEPESYWADASCVDLVRKMALKGARTAQSAVNNFLASEKACWRTNKKVRTITDNHGLTMSDMAFADRLDRWKDKIRTTLGPVPLSLEPRFSGGSTTSTRKLESTIFDKLSMTPESYGHDLDVVEHLFYDTSWGAIAHERRLYPTRVRGNIYFTVPKNGRTDRSCCMEADINLSFQLAVGAHIRKRLLKTLFIDLNHGAEHHALLACYGSLADHIATVDLTGASDHWARELVRYLLPQGWRELLDSLRATHTSFGGKWLYLEKFSSMGNGFTFELETVLFATLAHVVRDEEGLTGDILCFGDDLIVEKALGIPLCAALQGVGHIVNQKKTFLGGVFRESCGGDFHSGVAVNTVKPETVPETPSDWIALANGLRRVAGGHPKRWALMKPVWDTVLRQLPNQIRSMRGPPHLGDTVIHDDAKWWAFSNGRVRGWVPVVLERELSYYDDVPIARILGSIRTPGGRATVPLPKVVGFRSRWLDPEVGSRWLPGDRFRKIDPRVTRLKTLVGHRMPQSGVFSKVL